MFQNALLPLGRLSGAIGKNVESAPLFNLAMLCFAELCLIEGRGSVVGKGGIDPVVVII